MEAAAGAVLACREGEGGALSEGFNVGLLALLLVIAVLVAISNVWLRRRAEREAREAAEAEKAPAESPQRQD